VCKKLSYLDKGMVDEKRRKNL